MSFLNSHTQIGLDNVTAKDSFLKNAELKAMTFSHLPLAVDSDYYYDENRRWLLNAALTCKDFLDVALDALWERMYSLVPLLKLLPALQIEDDAYVCANVHVFLYDLTLFLECVSGRL